MDKVINHSSDEFIDELDSFFEGQLQEAITRVLDVGQQTRYLRSLCVHTCECRGQYVPPKVSPLWGFREIGGSLVRSQLTVIDGDRVELLPVGDMTGAYFQQWDALKRGHV